MFVKIHKKCLKNRKQINVGIFILKQKKNYKEVISEAEYYTRKISNVSIQYVVLKNKTV